MMNFKLSSRFKLVILSLFYNKFLIKFLSMFIKNKQRRRKLRKKIIKPGDFYFKALLDSHKDYTVIMPPPGAGDTLLICGLIKEFKIKSQNQILLIVTSQYYKNIAELVNSADKIHLLPKTVEISDISKKQLHDVNIYNSGGHFEYNNMLQGFAAKLDLPNVNKLSFNFIKTSDSVEDYFKRLNLKIGKTILISTEAVSYPDIIDLEDWRILAQVLKAMGYDIVFNSCKENFFEFKTLFLNPKEIIAFTEVAGGFLGYRSGLCDLIAGFTNIKQFILYCNLETHDYFTADEVMVVTSLKDQYDCINVKEYMFSTMEELKQELQNFFFI